MNWNKFFAALTIGAFSAMGVLLIVCIAGLMSGILIPFTIWGAVGFGAGTILGAAVIYGMGWETNVNGN